MSESTGTGPEPGTGAQAGSDSGAQRPISLSKTDELGAEALDQGAAHAPSYDASDASTLDDSTYDASDASTYDDSDDDLEPADAVPAGTVAARGTTPARGGGSTAVGPRRDRAGIRNLGTFYRQVVAELRKVIWPTRRELVTYTSVVLAFVVTMVVIVAFFDFVFGQAVLHVFGA